MPLKTIIIIFSLVGLASIIHPAWSMMFIWAGGMALLWIMTGQWLPPSPNQKTQDTDAFTPQSEQIRPLDDAIEADDIEDLARLDGEGSPANEYTQKPEK